MEAKRNRKGWADAFMGAVVVAVLFFYGCSGAALVSEPLPAAPVAVAPTELKINLRTDRAIYADALSNKGQGAVIQAPMAADAQCVVRYGAGHFAAVIVSANMICVNPRTLSIETLSELFAARFP